MSGFKLTPDRIYHQHGTIPQNGEILVFGSNLRGHHGAGAALLAFNQFGAKEGEGIGHFGQSYALPTKDEYLKALSLNQIVYGINIFTEYTYSRPDLRFFVTRVGCGYARYEDKVIAPLFAAAINCSFPEQWKIYLEYF